MELSIPPFIAETIPTPMPAGELERIAANTFSAQPWREQIAQAAVRNAGFGDSNRGFLAWSRLGFVNLRNTNLTSEQNMRLARLSLQLGLPVEKLPSGTDRAFAEGQQRWIEEFLNTAERQVTEFQSGVRDSIDLREGKLRFGLKLDENLGVVLNYYYKKRSGIKRLGRRIAREWGELSQNLTGRRLLSSLRKRSSIVESTLRKSGYDTLLEMDPLYRGAAATAAYGRGEISLRDFSRVYANSYATVASITPSPTGLTGLLKNLQIFVAKSIAEGKVDRGQGVATLLSLKNL